LRPDAKKDCCDEILTKIELPEPPKEK